MKTLVLSFLKILCIRIIPLIKLQNFRKRKIDIAHHRTADSICTCILPRACWKSPERACLSHSDSVFHDNFSELFSYLHHWLPTHHHSFLCTAHLLSFWRPLSDLRQITFQIILSHNLSKSSPSRYFSLLMFPFHSFHSLGLPLTILLASLLEHVSLCLAWSLSIHNSCL